MSCLKAEGIFRINADNSQEERVRDQLNRGVVPHGIDVHCLAGLIKVNIYYIFQVKLLLYLSYMYQIYSYAPPFSVFDHV